MFNNVRSISSGTCDSSQFESIDQATCEKIASSRDVDFRTVSNLKYAPGCVQVGESVLYNNAPLVGGGGANDAVQQLCMLPGSNSGGTVDLHAADGADDKHGHMFDGTWLDKSIAKDKGKPNDGSNSGYFPVNIRTIHQAVFYVNSQQ